jgi:hypothetical protein
MDEGCAVPKATNGLAAQQDAVMRDVERSGRWLRAWVESQASRLRFPEPLESNREATAGLIRPWFLQISPPVNAIPRWFQHSAGEVMIAIS